MAGGADPDGIRRIVDAYARGDREAAVAACQRWLLPINCEIGSAVCWPRRR